MMSLVGRCPQKVDNVFFCFCFFILSICVFQLGYMNMEKMLPVD